MIRRRILQSRSTPRFILLALTAAAATLLQPGGALAQAKHYPLESVAGLRLNNVTAEPVTLHGKKGLKVVVSEEARRRYAQLTPEARGKSPLTPQARIEGLEFSNGVITAEIAGEPASDAGEGARGFVGIAFRVQEDPQIHDAFYLRPTNGRAEDQERRNHAVQYISHPNWPWSRLRQETPSRYEAYVDLVTGAWTRIKIEVSGDKARLYVHDQQQPTLIVNDVKSGPNAKGAVALWLEPGTVAHFRDLTVTPASTQK
jgi:hypothetical protein